ncbi:hypothetical protein [Mesobacillus campisalis]|nr:hypothetical protein [Mesobacillus campisalis]
MNNKQNQDQLKDVERNHLANQKQEEEFKNQGRLPDQQNRLKDQENRRS